MNDEIYKKILKFKMEFADLITELFPAPVKEPLKEWQRQVFQALHDASEEYLEKSKEEKDHNSRAIKAIVVDE